MKGTMWTCACVCLALVVFMSSSPAGAQETKTVRVSGFVRDEGPVKWTEGMTVADAIALAGGMTDPETDPEDFTQRSTVTRVERGKRKQLRARHDTKLLAGDELRVGRDLR